MPLTPEIAAQCISIHAPRMGSDFTRSRHDFTTLIFQSTLPGWGATCMSLTKCMCCTVFQSTLPGWGATAKMDIFAHDMGKIIHFQH